MTPPTQPTHYRVASDLLAQLHETHHYVNDRAISRLDESDAATVAIAALAHGVLALVEEVTRLVAE